MTRSQQDDTIFFVKTYQKLEEKERFEMLKQVTDVISDNLVPKLLMSKSVGNRHN